MKYMIFNPNPNPVSVDMKDAEGNEDQIIFPPRGSIQVEVKDEAEIQSYVDAGLTIQCLK